MLHRHTRQHVSQSIDQIEAEKEPGLSELYEFVVGIFRRQLFTVLSIAALVAAAGTLYALVTPPTYTARATMIIDKGTAQVQLGGVISEVPTEVDSQIQLIKSEAVALAVAKKLKLADDPEFEGKPTGVRRLLHALHPSFLAAEGQNLESDRTRIAAFDALARLKVVRTGYVFDIDFWSFKPERAAQIANAFASAYIADQLSYKSQVAGDATAWLKTQIQELRDQSLAADEKVTQFKAKNNIVVAADGRLINDQQMSLLNTQLVAAREKTAETRARLDRIEAILNSNVSDARAIPTVTDTLTNPVIVKLRQQYLDFTSREAIWVREYGPDHLAVVNLRRQIQEIRASIADELRRIAETYKSEHAIAKQRQAELEKAVTDAVAQSQDTNRALATLRDLESAAETYRGLYRNALQRGTDLVQKQSYPGADARLVMGATPPPHPSSLPPLLIICASAIGGLMLGFGAGAVRATLDRVFRTPSQIETILQTKCVALVPAIKARSIADAKLLGSIPTSGRRIIVRNSVVSWDVVDQPLARFAEAMRTIRLEMQLGGSTKPVTTLGFTSSLPKEGKSTIACAFSLLTAQSGTRTILVDCDLRNPALSGKLAPKAEVGLLEVLSGKVQLEDAVWTDPVTGLTFLPSVVTKAQAAGSSTILASGELRAFFEKLRKSYDCVVADFSPAAPIIDVQGTAGLVDAYVFVVAWSQTKIDVAQLALGKATSVQDNLLGVVLNKVDFKTLGRYEGYRGDYYSDKYYGQYGQV